MIDYLLKQPDNSINHEEISSRLLRSLKKKSESVIESTVRITRASVYLKPALVQVAHAAVKSNKFPYYKVKYERIMKRCGKKHTIIAVAWMIFTAVYHMLSTGEDWNPTNLYKMDMPEPLKNKQKEKAVRQTMKLLIAEGLIKESQLTS